MQSIYFLEIRNVLISASEGLFAILFNLYPPNILQKYVLEGFFLINVMPPPYSFCSFSHLGDWPYYNEAEAKIVLWFFCGTVYFACENVLLPYPCSEYYRVSSQHFVCKILLQSSKTTNDRQTDSFQNFFFTCHTVL